MHVERHLVFLHLSKEISLFLALAGKWLFQLCITYNIWLPVLNISIFQTYRYAPSHAHLVPIRKNYLTHTLQAKKDEFQQRHENGKMSRIRKVFFTAECISSILFVRFKCCSFIRQIYLPNSRENTQ